jgi:hypothetical protein
MLRTISGRILLVLALLLPLSAMRVVAQDTAGEEPWQAVITQQIEAFRHQDAPGAFQFAGKMFHAMYPTAEEFFITIMGGGYAPIMESASHSFGEFKLDPEIGVVQEVKFVGPDQELYEAYYQLQEEAEGWRVQGVMLARAPGVGV